MENENAKYLNDLPIPKGYYVKTPLDNGNIRLISLKDWLKLKIMKFTDEKLEKAFSELLEQQQMSSFSRHKLDNEILNNVRLNLFFKCKGVVDG